MLGHRVLGRTAFCPALTGAEYAPPLGVSWRRTAVRLGAALVFALGCAPDTEETLFEVGLRLPADPCAPPVPLDELVVEALGDFPPSDGQSIEVLRAFDPAGEIERFPVETLQLRLRARAGAWEGAALAGRRAESVVLPEVGPFGALAVGSRVLALPFGRACPAGGDVLWAPGTSLVALPGGALAVAGGEDGELGSRRFALLGPAGETLNTEAMALRRAGAVAVVVGGELWVLGGAPGATGPAQDTFERWDIEGERWLGLGGLLHPRRDAAALALGDDAALIVGGVGSGAGAPLDSVVRVERDGSRELSPLPVARRSPVLVGLGDGSIVLLGGRGPGGEVLREVLAFDPGTEAFLDSGLRLPPGLRALGAVALAGDRIWAFGETDSGPWWGLLRRVPPELGGAPALALDALPLDALPGPSGFVSGINAATLGDGRVLLYGMGTDGEPLTGAYSPATGEFEALEAAAPVAVLALGDGRVAEFGEGLSFRLASLVSPFDNPPATLLGEDLILDGPSRWRRDGPELVAEAEHARADVPGFRAGDFSLRFAPTGPVDLLLLPAGRPPMSVAIDDASAGPALCTIDRAPGAALLLERRGSTLRLESSGQSRGCTLSGLVGRVGVALRARRGSRFRGLSLQRLSARAGE